MCLAVRTGAFRWLRLALAVLALVASHASVARAAFGTTCPRAGDPGRHAVVAGRAERTGDRAVQREVAVEAEQDASRQVPAQPAAVPPCATSLAALPAIIDVPRAVTAWDATALPPTPQLRPRSPSPSPPFRPPRGI